MQDKKYGIHVINLKQALNNGLVLKKLNRVIEFNQEVWLQSYIDMNAELKKGAKNDFGKYFFKLMNYALFGKIMENVRSDREINIKLGFMDRLFCYLVTLIK